MMDSDGYHDELNGWLTLYYDSERAARDCNTPVMVSTISVMLLQRQGEDTTDIIREVTLENP